MKFIHPEVRRQRNLQMFKTGYTELFRHRGQYWDQAVTYIRRFTTSLKHKLQSPPIADIRLLKVAFAIVAGHLLLITFRVYGEDGYTTDYKAKVYCKLFSKSMELVEFETIARRKTKSGIKLIHKKPKVLEIPYANGATRTLSGRSSTRVCTSAFFLFLKHLRCERPHLKFARAKKVASNAWQKLSEDEKMEFIRLVVKPPRRKKMT